LPQPFFPQHFGKPPELVSQIVFDVPSILSPLGVPPITAGLLMPIKSE